MEKREKKNSYKFWVDKVAEDILAREKKLKRGIKVFRTESGLGASGIPHVGSFTDVVKANAVALALEDAGVKAEFIPYADDRDGLRKVPLGFPDWLEKYIGAPVTDIPDPFKDGHASFGEHMASLLLDAIEKAGIKPSPHFGSQDYRKGIFNEHIHEILMNAEKIGTIIKKMSGQGKYVDVLPYFPVCENCGKIYTTRSIELHPKEHKVSYVCDGSFLGKNMNMMKDVEVRGCGHKGEASYFYGSGKLSWKVEFAMRWPALGIVFEGYGKDIRDSVLVNDEICRQILNFQPPVHVMWELFLAKGGKKISKSFGNVFTPQVWYNYGSPQSLMLLMLKRFEGTRELDVTDIPKYMDELNKLEENYFELKKIKEDRDKVNTKRLFEFVNLLKPPKKPSLHVAYDTWIELLKILPENEKDRRDFVVKKLKDFGHMKSKTLEEETEKFIEERLQYAKNWHNDFVLQKTESEEEFEIPGDAKPAIQELIQLIEREKDGEKIQKDVFLIAKKHGLQPPEFFRIVYHILLNQDRGPRLGPYIIERGKAEVIEKLEDVL
jgi:lysyl-tRNA synthetase class 1